MDMVWHDHEHIQRDPWPNDLRFQPEVMHQLPHRAQSNAILQKFAEQVGALVGAKRDHIAGLRTVVVMGQPDGSPTATYDFSWHSMTLTPNFTPLMP